MFLVILALVGWSTSCSSSTSESSIIEPLTTPQTTQESSQTRQSTAPSSDLATRLVGRWDMTSFQGNPVPSGTQVLTFSEEGTLQSTSSDGSMDFTAQYSVLDDSQIRITADSLSYVLNYSLNGDTLTVTAQNRTATFQRTRVD